MIFRQLTGNNDWTFGQGVAGYATDEAAIELNVKTRLQSWKNDCFFAQQDYVDWLARLDKGQLLNLTTELQTIIIQSYGIVAVTSIKAVLNDVLRYCVVNANITTIYSPSFLLTLQLQTGLQVVA